MKRWLGVVASLALLLGANGCVTYASYESFAHPQYKVLDTPGPDAAIDRVTSASITSIAGRPTVVIATSLRSGQTAFFAAPLDGEPSDTTPLVPIALETLPESSSPVVFTTAWLNGRAMHPESPSVTELQDGQKALLGVVQILPPEDARRATLVSATRDDQALTLRVSVAPAHGRPVRPPNSTPVIAVGDQRTLRLETPRSHSESMNTELNPAGTVVFVGLLPLTVVVDVALSPAYLVGAIVLYSIVK